MTAPAKKATTKKAATKKTVTKKTAGRAAVKKTVSKKKVAAGSRKKKSLAPGTTMTEALGESFLQDLVDDWHTHGAGVIEICRTTKPDAYLKLIATYAPKEFRKTLEPFEGLTNAALQKKLEDTLIALRSLGVDPGARTGR